MTSAPVSALIAPASTASTHVTDVPPSLPTMVPQFDVGQVARNAEVVLADDDVYVALADVAWSSEKLDLAERAVLAQLDGIAPVWLVESALQIPRDELHSTLCVLQARGLVALCERPPESGVFASRRTRR